jgi:hypothetical protein
MLTELCIYTIKHSVELRATLAKRGHDTYTEKKKWSRAKKLLDEAQRCGMRLPIVFAPAEDTSRLFAWALLDKVVPDKTSSYTFSEMRLFKPRPAKSTLLKDSDSTPLDEWFIRPYAICQTPPYLHKASERNTVNVRVEPKQTI